MAVNYKQIFSFWNKRMQQSWVIGGEGAGAGFDWHHHAIDSYIFASVAEYDEDKQGKTCRSGF